MIDLNKVITKNFNGIKRMVRSETRHYRNLLYLFSLTDDDIIQNVSIIIFKKLKENDFTSYEDADNYVRKILYFSTKSVLANLTRYIDYKKWAPLKYKRYISPSMEESLSYSSHVTSSSNQGTITDTDQYSYENRSVSIDPLFCSDLSIEDSLDLDFLEEELKKRLKNINELSYELYNFLSGSESDIFFFSKRNKVTFRKPSAYTLKVSDLHAIIEDTLVSLIDDYKNNTI